MSDSQKDWPTLFSEKVRELDVAKRTAALLDEVCCFYTRAVTHARHEIKNLQRRITEFETNGDTRAHEAVLAATAQREAVERENHELQATIQRLREDLDDAESIWLDISRVFDPDTPAAIIQRQGKSLADLVRDLKRRTTLTEAMVERAAESIYLCDEIYAEHNDASHESAPWIVLSDHDHHRYRDRARAALEDVFSMP